jgi:L-amino acid N-acyltransferase YncA
MIRVARLDDLDAVARIYAHYVAHSIATFDTVAPDAGGWRDKWQAVAAAGWPFLVGEEDGEVIGYAYASAYRPRPAYRFAVEDSIYVSADRLGRGHGRALLVALLTALRATEARQVIAVIAVDPAQPSGASEAVHAAAGFTASGRLLAVGHKHDRWLDTVLMQLPLRPI